MDDRRQEKRRAEDMRLASIENQLDLLTKEVGRIRTSLGDRFTTLMFELDNRYMPREELSVVYIPRREQEARHQSERNWRTQLPIAVFAGLGWLTNLVLVLTHHT